MWTVCLVFQMHSSSGVANARLLKIDKSPTFEEDLIRATPDYADIYFDKYILSLHASQSLLIISTSQCWRCCLECYAASSEEVCFPPLHLTNPSVPDFQYVDGVVSSLAVPSPRTMTFHKASCRTGSRSSQTASLSRASSDLTVSLFSKSESHNQTDNSNA